MIVNNYDNSLIDNHITDWTFKCRLSPKLCVYFFEPRITYHSGSETKLTFQYYVNDALDGTSCYYTDNNEDLKNQFRYFAKDTFTIKVVINSDLDQGDPLRREFTQTTYAGIQCMEIGPFTENDLGDHFFSIEAIDSRGCGSGIQIFRYLIEPDNLVNYVVDLDSGNLSNGFESSYVIDSLDSSQKDTNNNPTPTNPSTKLLCYYHYKLNYISLTNKYSWSPYKSPVYKSTKLANYNVSISRDNLTNKVEKITIDVTGDQGDPQTQYIKGYRYDVDIQNWVKYGSPTSPNVPQNPSDTLIYDLTGHYELTTVYIDDNDVKHDLLDYISYQPNELPDQVIRICIKNKLALNALMDAAKAYGTSHGGDKVTLKLPEDLQIVLDRHTINQDNQIVDGEDLPIPNPPVAGDTRLKYKNEVIYPDKFTLDLNNSKVYVLQCNDISKSYFFCISDNYDTHVINGSIYGSYKYIKVNTSIPENVSNIAIYGSQFCTYENVIDVYTAGYDSQISKGGDSATNDRITSNSQFQRQFRTIGYIDYEGNLHNFNDSEEYAQYTSDELDQFNLLRCNEAGNYIMPYAKSTKDFINKVWFITRSGQDPAELRKSVSKDVFIHMYDTSWKFIETIKVRDGGFFNIPTNISYVLFSTYGNTNTSTPKTQNTICLNNRTGQYFAYGDNVAWCNAFINCKFHHMRTSLFDNRQSNQNHVKDCYSWLFGIERYATYGGFSNQNYLVDVEDAAERNYNFNVINFENLMGGGTGAVWMVQQGFNNSMYYCKGLLSATFQKALTGGIITGCSFVNLRPQKGYTDLVKYNVIQNNLVSTFFDQKGEKGNIGSNQGIVHIEYNSMLGMGGQFVDNIYNYNTELING